MDESRRSRRSLIVLAAALVVGLAALVLAEAADSPALAVVGVVAVLVAGAARWYATWGRAGLVLAGLLLAVIAVAFVASKVAG